MVVFIKENVVTKTEFEEFKEEMYSFKGEMLGFQKETEGKFNHLDNRLTNKFNCIDNSIRDLKREMRDGFLHLGTEIRNVKNTCTEDISALSGDIVKLEGRVDELEMARA